MRTPDAQNRMHAPVREARADPAILERRLEQVLAQAVALLVPIAQFAVLHERNGIVCLASVLETGAPNRAVAHLGRVDELLVVNDREIVALLQAEEVDAPCVDLRQFHSQTRAHSVVDHAVPERALDRGGFHPPLDGHFLRVLADVDRVAAQIDDQVVGRRRLVDEIGEPGRRVFLAEYGERLAEPDILETEDRFGRFGDPVDGAGSDSVPGQNLAGRLSLPDNTLLDVVPLLVDAEQQLDRFFLGRLFGRQSVRFVPAAQADDQNDGNDRDRYRSRYDNPLPFHCRKITLRIANRQGRLARFVVILLTIAGELLRCRRLAKEMFRSASYRRPARRPSV